MNVSSVIFSLSHVVRGERKRWREQTEEDKKFFLFLFLSIMFGAALKTNLLPDMSWAAQVERVVNKLLYLRPQTEPQGIQFIIVRRR